MSSEDPTFPSAFARLRTTLGQVDPHQAMRHVLFALAAGVVCGLASVALCLVADAAWDLFCKHTWLVWLLPLTGVLQLLLYKAWKMKPNLTTRNVVNSMRTDAPVSPFLAPGIFLGTCTSILMGASVGKEAGALQMGASLGAFVARPFGIKAVYPKNPEKSMNGYVAATGMAACFAALFFAPLGACMFVIELTHFRTTILRHTATMLLACFVAFAVASACGIGDVIPRVALPVVSWQTVALCVVIGVAAALVGTVFDSSVDWTHDILSRITKNYYALVIVGGLLFAALLTASGWQQFGGPGGSVLAQALGGTGATLPPWSFAIKLLLTLICLGFWFKGGEIMPCFCIGGLLGSSCALLLGANVSFGAAVGVIAFFAAFSRCPFAAFLMGCEIFGFAAAPFLAIGVAVAFMFGFPVGLYGEGVDKVIRTRWRDSANRIAVRQEQAVKEGKVGILKDFEAVGEGLKDTLNSPDDKV